MKAEHSEQEKRQAVSSIPRRISHKQRQESLESYWEAFLSPHKIIDRKASYLSRSTWERLEFVVRRLGDYGANVSSFLECITLRHLEDIQRGYRMLAQTLITAFRAINNKMNNRHSQRRQEEQEEQEEQGIKANHSICAGILSVTLEHCKTSVCNHKLRLSPLPLPLGGRAVITSFSSAGMPS